MKQNSEKPLGEYVCLQQDPLVNHAIELFLKARNDTVFFAQRFLNFQPYDYQKEVLRDQSNLIAACCRRQVGKTTLAAIKALHFALSHSSVRVLVISKGLRQSIYLFDKILELMDSCLPAKELKTYESRTKVRFANESEIIALPCGRDGSTLRGFNARMVIVDEANWVPPIVINSVISPMLITHPNAKKIMISTPWMKDHPFYEAFTRPELGFKTYTWPTSMNPKVTKESLEREKLSIGEYAFNREFNAIFLDDQFAYIPSKLVIECTEEYDLNNDPAHAQNYMGEYYVGVDFGKLNDHSALAILRKTSRDEMSLVYMKEFPLKTPYKEVIAWIRRLHDAYHFRGGSLDRTGVGEAVYENIVNFMPHIEGVTLTMQTKVDLMGRLKLLMENQRITIPRDKRLLTQITAQQCEPSKSGKLHFSHPPGTHDDLLWALALACKPASQNWQRPIFKSGNY